ncbi:MAG: pre-peptidase C-terminal domain-containing protein [Halioglobus sp.]|nr:pre-peptidase C-terminal domain-containing protein [Halioglobus sp.]
MNKAPRICFDRLLPQDLSRPRPTRMMAGGRVRAIAPKGKQWINGSTLTIRFMGGTPEQQDMVRDVTPAWTEHANLHFEFTDDPRAKIRVTFDPGDGAWSYVGTDNLGIPLHAATLNLGWLDDGVILHEFGHMIGLAHEHQSPLGGIVWNEAAVIRDLSGPPNFWDEDTIRHNVLEKYTADQINGTEFDPESIMLYAFPDAWTENMGATRENSTLSDLDKLFVESEKMYPGRRAPEDAAVELPVCTATAADIASAGEEDLYQFTVASAGVHTVQTFGATDAVLTLFGPNSPTAKIGEDDDSGQGRNARIDVALQPGTYYARVRHYDPGQTGSYRIQVSAT